MLVQAGFCKRLNKMNKGGAMMSLMISSIITSRKAELDQFAIGLGPVLQEAKKFPEMCRRLFVYDGSMDTLSPQIVKNLLYMDQLESNLKEYLEKYIESKGTIQCFPFNNVNFLFFTHCNIHCWEPNLIFHVNSGNILY